MSKMLTAALAALTITAASLAIPGGPVWPALILRYLSATTGEISRMSQSLPRSNDLLASLPPELFTGLFAKGRTISLAADQMLFLAGDVGDGCYRVDEGLLKV